MLDYKIISINNYTVKEIPNFLSIDDCDKIIEIITKQELKPSEVYSGSLDNLNNNTRKSNQCWLNDNNHDIKKLSEKITKITNTQNNYTEDLQVVSYDKDGFFNYHYDACAGNKSFCKRLNHNGYRLYTVLIYLNDDFEGGETVFPKINKTIKPEKGKAVIFQNVLDDGTIIAESLHGGNSVLSGNKYICNKWIRTKKIN